MKKSILITIILLSGLFAQAQITLEHTYPTGALPPNYLSLVKLSSSGYKYVMNNGSTITLYNLDHTVFRTITIPPLVGWGGGTVQIFYISEGLFNTDTSSIAYLLTYVDTNAFNPVVHARVFDQNGNILFSKDSAVAQTGESFYGYAEFISYTPSGFKMIIYDQFEYGTSAYVYSLPGTLPCHDCTNGTITSIAPPITGNGGIANYPNPSKGQTTVEYTLPQGITTADLVFYNMAGQELKRYKVTNAFRDILVNTADLDAGTYYYQIQTSDFKAGKKMVVIR